MSNIGSIIRSRRIELDMTQEELANKLGYKSKSTINKIELGINDIPQSKIVQFANALDTTPSVLMGWVEVTPEVQKNNDIMADIIVRIRTDADFLSVIELLNNLDSDQLASVKQMLKAFNKDS